MVGASLGLAGRYEPYRLICRWLNVKRPGRCAPLGSTGGGYCVWLFHIKQIKQKILRTAACFPTKRQVGGKRYEGNAEDFCKRIYLTSFCFPLFTHRGINYPPAAGWAPFLSIKDLRFAIFPQLSFAFLIFTREYSASLLQSARITPTRESNMDSC